jgi:hypothetical protein
VAVDGRRLGLSAKAAAILEQIPWDTPVTSSQLSQSLPYTSREIGATISSDLLIKYVVRKKDLNGWAYLRKA